MYSLSLDFFVTALALSFLGLDSITVSATHAAKDFLLGVEVISEWFSSSSFAYVNGNLLCVGCGLSMSLFAIGFRIFT